MGSRYGVFTIERADLVSLSKRIAECVPADFLKDKDKPVIIGVDGTLCCGKKIFADYGRDGALQIDGSKLFNEEYASELTRFGKVKKLLLDMIKGRKNHDDKLNVSFHGAGEYDEYVRGNARGVDFEVSFINLAWNFGYSFSESSDEAKNFNKHLNLRTLGGLIYVHNSNVANIEPDISIRLEAHEGSEIVNGQPRRCPNVHSAVSKIIGEDKVKEHASWLRYVEVEFNNAAINDGKMLQMLRDEFGFVDTEEMHEATLKDSWEGAVSGEGETQVPQECSLPIVKSHARLAKSCDNVM